MSEQLHFTADAALIDRLGRELVGKQETALVELVKNSYDADATEVRVTFDEDRLVIDDNGAGMNREELVDGFLKLASDMKVRRPLSDRFERRRAGRKGIGRFATQRLGSYLVLRTWNRSGEPGLELRVDWDLFARGQSLDAIPVTLDTVPPRHAGTVIEIGGLRDTWSEAQIRRCWRGVVNLQRPFPVAPVAGRPAADPGFEVSLQRAGGIFSPDKVVADIQTEVLDHMHAVVELRVGEDGLAEWRMSRNRFGATTDWAVIHHGHPEAQDPPRYAHLKNAWMKAHYAILEPAEFSPMAFTRVRELLSSEGGIRLYRNGFRVVPYGDADDDWLRLDEAYSRRSFLFPIANRNWFGVIEVHDPEGKVFEEHTSREGLIETPGFLELRDLVSSVLVTAARLIAEQRNRKVRAGGSGTPPTEFFLKRLRDAARKARGMEGTSEEPENQGGASGGDAPLAIGGASALLTEAADVIEEATAHFADETAMLRLLATLGLIAAEFSHETGMTFQAVRLDFQRIFAVALAETVADGEFSELVERARGMLERLDALTSYLNELASARSARQLAPVSVSRTVEEFKRGLRQLAARSETDIQIETPAYDALYTKPMHKAEIASVLLNFYSNSIKAMRRTSGERRILVEAERDDAEIVVRFSDTGDGISEENRERVFDLFFTTRAAAATSASTVEESTGTGLGLWIVRQIVSKVGGTVEVTEARKGYATTIEVRLPAEEEG